jgi:hypothetical protein
VQTVLGLAVGVIGLLYAVLTHQTRELAVCINETRTTVVRSGQTTDLQVIDKGQTISTDITALQVTIWNSGEESIRPESVLEPITLLTEPKVQ